MSTYSPGFGFSQIPSTPPVIEPDYNQVLNSISTSDRGVLQSLQDWTQYQKHQDELSREDNRSVQSIAVGDTVASVVAANPNRRGISFFNGSSVQIYVGDVSVSRDKYIFRLEPGSFVRLPESDSIFELSAIAPGAPAGSLLQFTEYLHDPSLDQYAGSLSNGGATPPATATVASVAPNVISQAAGNTQLTFQLPASFAGQAVAVRLVNQDTGAQVTAWNDAVNGSGQLLQDSTNWFAAGAQVGSRVFLEFTDTQSNKISSALINITP